MQTQLYTPGGQSPFDTIKQIRPDGSEFWSARDLMDSMGYSYWKNFETPLNRAMETARNEGLPVEILFTRSGKKSLMGRPKEDYELARYAAYLVAMNGDPNMPKVAAAQSYFAIQTRVAETAPTKSPAELSRKEILLLALEAEERAEQAEAQVKQLTPAATAYGHWQKNDGGMSRRELCQKLREIYPGMNEARLREHMVKRGELVTRRKSSKSEEIEYIPGAKAYDRGFARRYVFTDRTEKARTGYLFTHKYYEELVARFSKTMAPAGQQAMLEVA